MAQTKEVAVNELLRFANAQNANVMSYLNWLATGKSQTGFTSGIAKSDEVNRVLAQGALAGYVMGELIVSELNKSAKIESGTFFEDFKTALASFVPASIADGSLVFSKIDPDAMATIEEAIAATTNYKILTPLMARHEILAIADLIVPVGSYMMMDAEPHEDYYCLANGGAYLREKYARLYAKWGIKYGAGDGVNTFNVSNLHGRVLQGTANFEDVGKYLEAMLPNITGWLSGVYLLSDNLGYGLLRADSPTGLQGFISSNPGCGWGTISASATNSSSVYSGDKLQPSALQLLACIRV